MGELTLFAYSLCGIRRTALAQEHMQDAHTAVNLLLADWLNKGVNLWQSKKTKSISRYSGRQ